MSFKNLLASSLCLLCLGLPTAVLASVTLDSEGGSGLGFSSGGDAQLGLDDDLGIAAGLGVTDSEGSQAPFGAEDESMGGHQPEISEAFVPGPPPIDGDVNLDGCVDFADFLIIQVNFGPGVFGKVRTDGDLNGDGQVDFADFLILQVNFGNKLIPEPGSMLVWGGLLGCVIGCSRKRRQRHAA